MTVKFQSILNAIGFKRGPMMTEIATGSTGAVMAAYQLTDGHGSTRALFAANAATLVPLGGYLHGKR